MRQSDDGQNQDTKRQLEKNNRLKRIDKVMRLHLKGASMREIEAITGVPESTAVLFINEGMTLIQNMQLQLLLEANPAKKKYDLQLAAYILPVVARVSIPRPQVVPVAIVSIGKYQYMFDAQIECRWKLIENVQNGKQLALMSYSESEQLAGVKMCVCNLKGEPAYLRFDGISTTIDAFAFVPGKPRIARVEQ